MHEGTNGNVRGKKASLPKLESLNIFFVFKQAALDIADIETLDTIAKDARLFDCEDEGNAEEPAEAPLPGVKSQGKKGMMRFTNVFQFLTGKLYVFRMCEAVVLFSNLKWCFWDTLILQMLFQSFCNLKIQAS